MARLNVNPTRMELKRLKASLSTAKRGHKLLKDKSDEMIRRFSVLVKENKRLRDLVEGELAGALRQFSMASGLTGKEQLEKAFSMPAVGVEADYKTKSIMGVVVPDISVKEERRSGLPYAFADITSEADYSVRKITAVISLLLRLAQVEKSVAMLSEEIERNKRRVNALEYVMIPRYEETIAYIRSKLDENERAATTRLMKVKSMLAEQNS